MTNLKERTYQNYSEIISKEFYNNTFDKVSAHIKTKFSKDKIPNEFLIIATIYENDEEFEGIVINKEALTPYKLSNSLHLKASKIDAEYIWKNAYTWQFKENIGILFITTL